MHIDGLARGWKDVKMWQRTVHLPVGIPQIVCWIVPIPFWHP